MRTSLFTFLFIVIIVAVASASVVPDQPIETIYWRQFKAVFAVGEQVLAVGPRGVVTFDWNEQKTQLQEKGHTRFAMEPKQSKLFGDELWVSETGNRIQIFSVDPNLAVSHLYTATIPHDFADFTRYGDDIIVSRNFDGLWRYRLAEGVEPQFIDTSYKGINLTTVLTDGDNLYALDQYNGVMRYDLRGDTFGSFQEYMYSEYEATSCSKFQGQFFLTGISSGVIEGSFGKTGSGVEKVTATPGNQKRVTTIEDRIIIQSERKIGWIDRNSPTVRIEWAVDDGLLGGAVYYPGNGDAWFLYPNLKGGITRYSLHYGADPSELLDRPGPITGLAFAKGRLVTGGRHSPIDVMELDSTGHPAVKFAVTESHPATSALATTGDTILAIYPEAERLGVVEVDFTTGNSTVVASILVDTADVLDLRLARNVRGNRDLALIRYPFRVDVFELLNPSGLSGIGSWNTNSLGAILAYEVIDSIALFATTKNSVYMCVLDSDLAIGSTNVTNFLGKSVTGMDYSEPYLMMFRGTTEYSQGSVDVYNLASPTPSILIGSAPSPKSVADFQRFDKYLFTVGGNGIQIFDASDSIPVLVDTGGWDGALLAVDSNHLVVSDGHAIDFYQLSLFTPGIPPDDTGSTPPPPPALPRTFAISQNYPNPFNGTTYIEYDIPQRSSVSIELYNVLGQRVRTLVSGSKDPGKYRAMWDGLSDEGVDVASGVYYYRFSAGESRMVRKMLYLK
ncbi:MAG: FlgD immunoglobulin-like domain containing protein [Candidatus Zixiibacteriota bacterium]